MAENETPRPIEPDESIRTLFERTLGELSSEDREATRTGSVSLGGFESRNDESGARREATREFLDQIATSRPRHTRYRGGEEIARGAQGAVLKVWDGDIRRSIAMKVLIGRATDQSKLGRFLEEAQVTGQLEHPGIVPVHELGVDPDGRTYFTMRLVKGRELREIIDLVHARDEDWNLARALGVVLRVCETVAYAHSRGVIHRDLKPSNIMVGQFGEVYVMDWGLAKIRGVPDAAGSIDDSESHDPLGTRDGTVIGTPAYMPPEQALGRIDLVDERSDVYALGAILYHLLAGKPPFAEELARGSTDFSNTIAHNSPTPVGALNPTVPADLRFLCETAMRRKQRGRYADCEELAEDLREYLEGGVPRSTKPIESQATKVMQRPAVRLAIGAAILGVAALAVLLLNRAGVVVRYRPQASAASMALVPWIEKRETDEDAVFFQLSYDTPGLDRAAANVDGYLEFRDFRGDVKLRLDHQVVRARPGERTDRTQVGVRKSANVDFAWATETPIAHMSIRYVAESIAYEDGSVEAP
ncbi:MAG: serine/threonine protein kinase [bacterium]|nr:serine/threonine protein kinase [bacterium]